MNFQNRHNLFPGARVNENQLGPSFYGDYQLQNFPQRRARQGGPRHFSSSYPAGSISGGHAPFNSMSSISPTTASAFPFFNTNSSIGGAAEVGLLQQESDRLTGGAQMSPSANNFLPSDLLGDDDTSISSFPRPLPTQLINPYLASTDQGPQPPQSPLSTHSQSPSLLSSPHESLHNVNMFHPGQDPSLEGDRRSITSTSSPYVQPITATSGAGNSGRMATLFGFNRQRGKSSLSELPQLGSLKASQSQSFPTNMDEPGSGGSGRRKLSSGAWANQWPSLFRGQTSPEGSGNASPSIRGAFPRKTRRGVFGGKIDAPLGLSSALDAHHSPSRPSSTYSYDPAVAPRSSSDNASFGWGGIGIHSRQRSSVHGADAVFPSPWNGGRSRRQSLQMGSTSNLSIGSTPLEPEELKAKPAPIGTERFRLFQHKKPPAANAPPEAESSKPTPKLNPAAPSFTARLFQRPSMEARRAAKADKDKSEGAADASESSAGGSTGGKPGGPDESSPPLSRRSKDTSRSIATTASLADSSDHAPPLAVETPPAATSAPRESFMSRLTRKSSSGKFPAPWSKDRGTPTGPGSDSGAGSGTGSVRGAKHRATRSRTDVPTTPGESDDPGDYVGQKGGGAEPKTPGEREREKAGRSSLSWSRVIGKKSRRSAEMAEGEGTAAASATEEED